MIRQSFLESLANKLYFNQMITQVATRKTLPKNITGATSLCLYYSEEGCEEEMVKIEMANDTASASYGNCSSKNNAKYHGAQYVKAGSIAGIYSNRWRCQDTEEGNICRRWKMRVDGSWSQWVSSGETSYWEYNLSWRRGFIHRRCVAVWKTKGCCTFIDWKILEDPFSLIVTSECWLLHVNSFVWTMNTCFLCLADSPKQGNWGGFANLHLK